MVDARASALGFCLRNKRRWGSESIMIISNDAQLSSTTTTRITRYFSVPSMLIFFTRPLFPPIFLRIPYTPYSLSEHLQWPFIFSHFWPMMQNTSHCPRHFPTLDPFPPDWKKKKLTLKPCTRCNLKNVRGCPGRDCPSIPLAFLQKCPHFPFPESCSLIRPD
jgi:hypothetical protein